MKITNWTIAQIADNLMAVEEALDRPVILGGIKHPNAVTLAFHLVDLLAGLPGGLDEAEGKEINNGGLSARVVDGHLEVYSLIHRTSLENKIEAE